MSQDRYRYRAALAATCLLSFAVALGGACASDASTSNLEDDPVCGDMVCDGTETKTSCAEDCAEATCGDDVCQASENATSCAQDCSCGNQVCEANLGETAATCAQDCAVCGDGVCSGTETPIACAQDCAATVITRNQSDYSVWFLYVYSCTAPSEGSDMLGDYTLSPGFMFTLTGVPPGCYLFHATDLGLRSWRTPTGVNLTAGQTYNWTLL